MGEHVTGIGFFVGGAITAVTEAFLNVANNVISWTNETFYKWKFEVEANPLLLGIGFIVGMEVSLAMFAGSILANFAIMPLIGYFAELGREGATVWNDSSVAINAMQVSDIAGSYVKYIGAGMMLAGGFIISGGNVLMAIVATILSIVLSLLFIIVSGRLTGTIGTSNLPVSGMTIASIVIVTLLFVTMGWKDTVSNKALLLFGTFIVTAISVAGGYSQSQKVTFVVGGDKKEMDKYFTLSGLIGVASVVGTILLLSDQLAITGDNVSFALPQANLMSTLTSGIMSGDLPWEMIIVGIVMGIVLYMLKLPIMTVAIGFYLPIATTAIILVGALVRLFIEKTSKSEDDKDAKVSNGVSLSSGLVAGGSIIGLVGIIFQLTGVVEGNAPNGFLASNGMAVIILIILVVATVLTLLGSNMKNAKQ